MLVVRFKVQGRPERTEEVLAAMRAVVAPSRALPGVIHFDIARDVTDPDALIATEVFEDRHAMERQESTQEVAAVVGLLEGGALASPPEWTIYEVGVGGGASLTGGVSRRPHPHRAGREDGRARHGVVRPRARASRRDPPPASSALERQPSPTRPPRAQLTGPV